VQIPVLGNQVSLNPAPNVQREPLRKTGLQQVGAALQDVGGVLHQVEKQEQLKADRAAFMEADRNTDTVANDLYTAATSTQYKDAAGVTDKSLAEFDKHATQIEAGLKTERQKTVYRESVNQRRATLQRQIGNHEGQEAQRWQAKETESYKDQAHVNAVTYYDDPKRVEAEIDKMRSAIDQTPGLSAEARAAELGIRRSGAYAGVIQRYLANDNIKGAEAYYKTVKGKVDGDKAAWIENALTDAKRVAQARAQAAADHREVVAERAMNEIDRQIASGVPATPAMWAGWAGKVRGSAMEDEFQNRVKDETEVQDLLRKPIDQQMKAVQERTSALDTGGGTLREVANLQRLQTAVKKNLTTLQEAPLLFNANRLGIEAQAVDLAQLQTPEVAGLLQDRVTQIQALRKQYGTQVAMRPLLPQEVDQINTVVKTASPEQLKDMYSDLYGALGNDEAYLSVMQQIAPDSPVRAYAGVLAARRSTAIVTHHVFSPDVRAQSGDVAATLLQGEAILQPTKDAKGQDGKPRVGMYIPETNTLQQQFQEAVGDAFAGRPDAAQTAFQAVKAYYVGKAAQTGRLASDNIDIDPKILKEAVTATIGTVVDAGSGSVIAPWGMDESQFQDAANAEFSRRAGDVNWPGGRAVPLAQLGMKAAGPNAYYVTAGRSYLMDKAGNPLVLKIEAQ
jgi:hypothetical protein